MKLTIERVINGYKLYKRYEDDGIGIEDEEEVIQDDDCSDGIVNIKSGLELLYSVREYFSLWGTKHDKDRIIITSKLREKENKLFEAAYEHGLPLEDEKAGGWCKSIEEIE